jgi:MSHA biogenesis protein MshJ
MTSRTWSQRLKQISQPYQRLAARERLLVLAAAAVVVAGVGHLVWIAPALAEHGRLQQQISTQQASQAAMRAQLQQLQSDALDPNKALRAQLQTVRQQLGASDQQFSALQQALVPPQQMGDLLQALLRQHRGLSLVQLRSLPVVALDESGQPLQASLNAAPAATAALAGAANTSTARAPKAWMYRHSLQVQVQGSYPELLAWVQTLETIPRRVQWGELTLQVNAWPQAQLVITLSTLSLEPSWWSV